jgi:putative salt-induced outer membrane protein YdiY
MERTDSIPVLLGCLAAVLMLSAPAWSQTPAAPPPVYTGAFGAGLAVTGGNTDTASFNLTFDLTRDPKTRSVTKVNALYLRSNTNQETTTDRLGLGFREELKFSERTFMYGAIGYLRDPFKDISYLINPQGGIGYKLVASDRAKFSLNGGAGAVWEKNPGIDVQTSGTLNAGQSFSFKISEMASIQQDLTGLWKTEDFNDALYHAGIALVTTITQRAQLKIEFLDDYKNVTPNPSIKKNDTAFITSFLYKF